MATSTAMDLSSAFAPYRVRPLLHYSRYGRRLKGHAQWLSVLLSGCSRPLSSSIRLVDPSVEPYLHSKQYYTHMRSLSTVDIGVSVYQISFPLGYFPALPKPEFLTPFGHPR